MLTFLRCCTHLFLRKKLQTKSGVHQNICIPQIAVLKSPLNDCYTKHLQKPRPEVDLEDPWSFTSTPDFIDAGTAQRHCRELTGITLPNFLYGVSPIVLLFYPFWA